jgi:hypothetical protein
MLSSRIIDEAVTINFRVRNGNKGKIVIMVLIITFLLLLNACFLSVGIIAPSSWRETNFALAMNIDGEYEEHGARSTRGIQITDMETFFGGIETDRFLSGQIMTVKCKVNHTNDYRNITGVKIKVSNPQNNITLVSKTEMEMLTSNSGPTWRWYKYDYTFPNPTPREIYTITVESTSNWPGDVSNPTITESFEIRVLNSLPVIKGDIDTIDKLEDDPDWILDLSGMKTDLEDSGEALKWEIFGVNESLMNITISEDNLNFHLMENASGSNQLTLTLTDSDNDSVSIQFWVYVKADNDPPVFQRPIPPQIRDEDSPPWTIDLTYHAFDAEDTPLNKFLNWSVFEVNESLIRIMLSRNSSGNFLTVYPVENAYGSNYIIIRAVDSTGATVAQRVWINLTIDNDPPVWSNIPSLYINTQEIEGALSLWNYISDIDTPLDILELKIKSVTPGFLNCKVDEFGQLNISTTHTDYNGPGTITVSAWDRTNEALTTINLTIFLAKFGVHLLAPKNGTIINSSVPFFHWRLDNPENLAPIYFDFYLHRDKDGVLNHESYTRESTNLDTTESSSHTYLKDDEGYYWTVVPKYFDKDGKEYIGKTHELIRNFRVSLNGSDQPPIAAVLSPTNDATINSDRVKLKWLGYDPNKDSPIEFELYFGTDYETVLYQNSIAQLRLPDPAQTFYELEDLKEDEIYYWTVIPTANNIKGTCLGGVSKFGVDQVNTPPQTVLLLPNDNVTVPKPPVLYWDYFDPDPFDSVSFDIFLSSDRTQVESLNPQIKITVLNTASYYLPSLDPGLMYYWTIIGTDRVFSGNCTCGVWSFFINQSTTNLPPITLLNSPEDNKIITSKSITISWNGTDQDQDKISYSIFFGTNYDSISNLDRRYMIGKVSDTSFSIDNLEHDKLYYWTVIPDDGKDSGLCLDSVRSFRVDLKGELNDDSISDSDVALRNLMLISLTIILIILFGSLLIVLRKSSHDRRIKRYLESSTKEPIPSSIKNRLLSSRTLRAIRAGDDYHPGTWLLDTDSTSDASTSTGKRSQPYLKGEHEPSAARSRYRPQSKLAPHVKHAIPYARGSEDQDQIPAKDKIELAKPLSKKIATDKPIKASSLPITKECPRCGSYKVKTFKDETSRCLDCRHRF